MNAIVLLLPSARGNPRNSEGSFVTLKDGRILYAWSRYTGEKWEDHCRADIAGCISSDNGHTWEPQQLLVTNEGECNVMSVTLLRLQDGRIALFYLQKNSALDCRLRVRFSDDEGQTWSDAVLCQPAAGYFVTNNDRVLQLRDGRLLVASAHHRAQSPDGNMEVGIEMHATACFFYSDDGGATWREGPQRLRIANDIESGLQEPGLIERSDGSLYGWARTTDGWQWEFESHDRGETWSTPRRSCFAAPCSPLSLKHIPELNRWVAVWNDPQTPVSQEIQWAQNSSWGRTPLALATSVDEGVTWSRPVLIENDPARGFCYIAIHPVKDALLLAYCCGGRSTAVLQDSCIRRVSFDQLPW